MATAPSQPEQDDRLVISLREFDALQLVVMRARDVGHSPGNEAALRKLAWVLSDYDRSVRSSRHERLARGEVR